ncbi:MAG TPA: hypothetical protein VFM09_01560 [Marmoricola sp.]|nr:hypothetical protein [Marmoricola sp.]
MTAGRRTVRGDAPKRVWRHPGWHVPPGQLALRAAVPVGVAAAVLAAAMVGAAPGWSGLLVALLAAAAVAQPDSMAGWALVVAVLLPWVGEPADTVTSPWLLLAAAGVVTIHVGLLLAAQGPAVLRPDAVQVRRWVGRGAGLWLVAGLLWLVARWVRSTPLPSGMLVAVLVVLGVVIVAAGARITTDGPPA